MNNAEIEELIIDATDHLFHPMFNVLSFNNSDNDRFNAYWDERNRCWAINQKIDPLSALLVFNKLERYMLGDDCHQTATVARFLDRQVPWIHSFQLAWNGLDNKSTSISGFVMGEKIRNYYLKLEGIVNDRL